MCSVACTGCKRCAQDAPDGLIEIVSGLAVIDYGRIELENPQAIERCPTDAIVWIDEQQFPSLAAAAKAALAATGARNGAPPNHESVVA